MPPLDDELWTLAFERAAASPAPTSALRDLLWRSLHLSGWRSQPLRASGGPPPTTDRALLERFVHGDAEAFETLVDRHGGTLLGYARSSLPDDEYAQDAVQEAFLALFSKVHELLAVRERNVPGFLFQATRSEVSKILREHLREHGPADPLPAAPSDEVDALAQLLEREREHLVALLHDTCTLLEQEVVLRIFRGQGAVEIAASLELEPDHVRGLEHRAKSKLLTAHADRSP